MEAGITLKLSWKMSGNTNDETNFLHKLLLSDRQIPKLRKTFGNNSSVIRLS